MPISILLCRKCSPAMLKDVFRDFGTISIHINSVFCLGGVNDIHLADGSNVLFTASWDMSVKVWNTVKFKPKDSLTGHKDSVQKVAVDSKFM